LLRLGSGCDAGCQGCIARGFSQRLLDDGAVESAVQRLSEVVDEIAILCPPPPLEALLRVLRIASRAGAALRLLVPHTRLEIVRRSVLEIVDEASIVVPLSLLPRRLRSAELKIVEALEMGFENVSLYIAADSEIRRDTLLSVLESVRGLGVRVRIGEPPYSTHHRDLRAELLRAGLRVGLASKTLFGYHVAPLTLGSFVAYTLFKDYERCRVVYLGPDGRVRRCPFDPEAHEDPSRAISRICPFLRRVEFVPRISIELVTRGNRAVSHEILQLLELIDQLNSVRRACESMGMNVSRCVSKIHEVEKSLGLKLVETHRGGRGGGFTVLTQDGMRILRLYRLVRQALYDALSSVGIHEFEAG